jgi:hypothetical protein
MEQNFGVVSKGQESKISLLRPEDRKNNDDNTEIGVHGEANCNLFRYSSRYHMHLTIACIG